MPDDSAQRTYEDLYPLYSKLYFTLGQRVTTLCETSCQH